MEYELYCYSAVEKRALADSCLKFGSGETRDFYSFGYQFNFPLAIHVMAEQQKSESTLWYFLSNCHTFQ